MAGLSAEGIGIKGKRYEMFRGGLVEERGNSGEGPLALASAVRPRSHLSPVHLVISKLGHCSCIKKSVQLSSHIMSTYKVQRIPCCSIGLRRKEYSLESAVEGFIFGRMTNGM